MKVVITGASRGIGKAIAEAFAAVGADLFLSARTISKESDWIENLRLSGIDVQFHDADLSEKNQVLALGEIILEKFGDPDVLVNNAGFFEPGSVLEEADGVLERTMLINLNAAYYLTRTLITGMKKSRHGFIFNICSIAALGAYPNGGSYSISKWALLGFNNNLREELKKDGIRVTAIHPGATMTDSWRGFGIEPSRIMEAEDIAKLVLAATTLSPQACPEQIIMRPQLGDI